MLKRLILFWRWVGEGFCYIRLNKQDVVSMSLNLAQQRLLAAMMNQAAAGKPIRIVCGKARKTGVSTFDQAFKTFLCAHYPNQEAVMIAHEAKATDVIFKIAKRVAKRYSPVIPTDPTARTIEYPGHDSVFTCHTAGGEGVGAGGTPNLLHLSELALWGLNKNQTEYNAKVSVPDDPTTAILYESTFKGRELFFQRFEEAADPENPYAQVFIAWYVDDRCTMEAPEGFSPDDEERAITGRAHAEGIELSFGQLQWRRAKIKELGEEVFRQEYPSTPEEAVQAWKGLILPFMRDCVVDALPWDVNLLSEEQLVGGIDFGYSDPTVIWTGGYQGGVLGLAQFYSRSEGLAADHVEGLVDGATYYCDPANLYDRQELAKAAADAGLHCRFRAAPRRKHVGEDIGCSEMKALVAFARSGRLQVVEEVSKQLLLECDNLPWHETTGRIDDRKRPGCGHFDAIYAMKYGVMGVGGEAEELAPQERRAPSRRSQFASI